MPENVIRKFEPKPVTERPAQPEAKPHKQVALSQSPWWRKYLMLGLLLAAVAAAYAAYVYETMPQVTVTVVKRQTLVQTLVVSGHIETPFRINIGSQVTGTVADVPVIEGQAVKAGDLLIKLNDRESQQAAAQAHANVHQAEAQLNESNAIYGRAAKLAGQGFASNAQFDAAKRALEVAQAQLDQAHAGLNAAEARLDYTEIRSPRDGVLISRNVERGQVTQPGATLLVVAPAGEIQLVAQIDELNLGLLQLGQTATAVADAYPGKQFDARLAYVNPAIDPQRGTVEIKLTVPNPPPYLTQDMSVSVEIMIGRQEKALALDLSAISDLSTPKPWVWVLRNGAVHKQTIMHSMVGDTALQVTDVINDGDQVVNGQKLSLKEGQSVRVKPNEQ